MVVANKHQVLPAGKRICFTADTEAAGAVGVKDLGLAAIKISTISKSSVAKLKHLQYKFRLPLLVAKTMVQQELCGQCSRRHDCGKVYEQLGNTEAPSIVRKVVLAFLLPLIVFTISLAILEKIFSEVISGGQIKSACSLVLALLVTFVFILLAQVINRRLNQDS